MNDARSDDDVLAESRAACERAEAMLLKTPVRRDAATVTALKVAPVQEERKKNGRQRYLRLFTERADSILANLTGDEVKAYLRLLIAYVRRDGDLPDDDRALARCAGVPLKVWAKLRPRLLDELGFAEVRDRRWIDVDQKHSLDLQRQASERQSARARVRWAKERRGDHG